MPDRAIVDRMRGVCPNCGESFALRKDGTLRKHTLPVAHLPYGVECLGSGLRPLNPSLYKDTRQ